ncbi:RNA-binding protein [Desulfurococcaceae archaeon MEX13E-LK6-19]|nr:RNA-binding protein [Desulfurococcaceae archaeon MEX13E-LK6-19]
MGKIYVANRQIVRPGDLLAEGEDVVAGEYTYREDNKVYSMILGLAEVDDGKVSVIPLEGTPLPKEGDTVIGLIVGVGITNWIVDIKGPYKAVLNANEALESFNPITDDLRKYLDVGDYIVAKIILFDRSRNPMLTIKGKGLGKITEGVVIDVKPSRVPRIIGKKRNMINMLTEMTGCTIIIGQNGRIWIRCPEKKMEDIVIRAIRKIEAEAHIPGLTERVRMFIEEEKRRAGL